MKDFEIHDAVCYLISQGRMPAVPRDDCYWHDRGGLWKLKTPGDIPLPQSAIERMLATPLKRLCDERGIKFRDGSTVGGVFADQRDATTLLHTPGRGSVTVSAMVEALRYFQLRDDAQAMRVIAEEVLEELGEATRRFGAFKSAHEGFAVAKEEMDELWAEVMRNQRDPERVGKMRAEAIQVAAMMIRFVHDSCGGNDG